MTGTGRGRRPSRRSVLGLGAAAGVGVALTGGRATAASGAGAETGAEASGDAGAAAAGGRVQPGPLDWSEPGRRWLRGVRLRHTTVVQSFAFDERNRRLYALQVISSGVRLPGESRAYTHRERVRRGDLCLNRLTMDGERLDHMYLKGFGHGTTLGLEEPSGGRTVLWTERDANPDSGYGRAICRFPYAAGRILTRHSTGPATYRPQPGSTNNYAALDLAHRRVLLRYRRDDLPRYALYDLDDFTSRVFVPLADFPQPGADLGLPFQGMAVHGAYAYQLLGSGYGPGNPPEGGGNVRLFRIGLRDGREVTEVAERTDPGLDVREPEGLAVMRRGGTRLFLGYAHGPAGGRRFSLYGKDIS